MLDRAPVAAALAEVGPEHAAKDLEQDLEAGPRDGRVVAALAELVADEGVLRPRELVPREDGAGAAQGRPDGVAPGVRDVRIAQAEDEGRFAAEGREEVYGVAASG